jgi:hypothetical protein
MDRPIIETTYLHIGTGKAGSSSIQLFLDDNYKRLRKIGYLVARAAGTNARQICGFFREGERRNNERIAVATAPGAPKTPGGRRKCRKSGGAASLG